MCDCCLQHRPTTDDMLANYALHRRKPQWLRSACLFAQEHFNIAVLIPHHPAGRCAAAATDTLIYTKAVWNKTLWICLWYPGKNISLWSRFVPSSSIWQSVGLFVFRKEGLQSFQRAARPAGAPLDGLYFPCAIEFGLKLVFSWWVS